MYHLGCIFHADHFQQPLWILQILANAIWDCLQPGCLKMPKRSDPERMCGCDWNCWWCNCPWLHRRTWCQIWQYEGCMWAWPCLYFIQVCHESQLYQVLQIYLWSWWEYIRIKRKFLWYMEWHTHRCNPFIRVCGHDYVLGTIYYQSVHAWFPLVQVVVPGCPLHLECNILGCKFTVEPGLKPLEQIHHKHLIDTQIIRQTHPTMPVGVLHHHSASPWQVDGISLNIFGCDPKPGDTVAVNNAIYHTQVSTWMQGCIPGSCPEWQRCVHMHRLFFVVGKDVSTLPGVLQNKDLMMVVHYVILYWDKDKSFPTIWVRENTGSDAQRTPINHQVSVASMPMCVLAYNLLTCNVM